jgi:hypothetical protein
MPICLKVVYICMKYVRKVFSHTIFSLDELYTRNALDRRPILDRIEPYVPSNEDDNTLTHIQRLTVPLQPQQAALDNQNGT